MTDELVASATDGGDRQPVGVAVAPTGSYTPDEAAGLLTAVWSLDGEDDPTRFDELLHASLVFIVRTAQDGYISADHAAADLLRSMARRVALGPDHPVGQP